MFALRTILNIIAWKKNPKKYHSQEVASWKQNACTCWHMVAYWATYTEANKVQHNAKFEYDTASEASNLSQCDDSLAGPTIASIYSTSVKNVSRVKKTV